MRLVERYVLSEHLFPFFIGFSVVTLILMLNFALSYLPLLVGKGIPLLIVLKLFLLATGWILALSVPCGVLVATLMTFGRMSQDNEITALKASGVHLGQLIAPALGGGFFLAVLLALFNNYILPDTNHAFSNLSIAIHRKAPAVAIRQGVFIDDFPDKSILVGEVNEKTGELKDISIYDFSSNRLPTTILAHEGKLKFSPDGTTLRLDLQNGEIHEVPADGDSRKYRRVQFKTHSLLLRNADAALEMTPRESRGEREMNIPRLKQEVDRFEKNLDERELKLQGDLDSLGLADYATFARRVLPAPKGAAAILQKALALAASLAGGRTGEGRLKLPDETRERIILEKMEVTNLKKRLNSYLVEIHKKFSIPFACIVFVLIGAPLGIRVRRGGMAASGISLGFFFLYYLFLIGGEQLADRDIVSPAVAMWAPNVLLGLPGLYLTWRTLQGREERG